MRNLTISLILAVIGAVFVLGLLLSLLYGKYSEKPTGEQPDLIAYKKIGRNLIEHLDPAADLLEQLESFEHLSGLSTNLETLEDFPVPAPLIESFIAGEPLALQSDETSQTSQIVSLNYFWPATNQIITLSGLELLKADTDNTNLNIGLTLAFYIGLLGILMLWLTPLIRRLALLRHTTRAFGKGDLESRISPDRASYLADIEQEFNRMADRIQTLMADNKLLSRAVSHDLKTPLARLRFGIDLLADSTNTDKRTKYHLRLEKDLTDMEMLVNSLLSYARLEEATIALDWQRIDLNTYVRDLLPEEHSQRNIQFIPSNLSTTTNKSSNIHRHTYIKADPRYLSMLINNILNNAIKYSHSQIILTVSHEFDNIILYIEDDGPGIKATERDHVLKPFYRSQEEQTTAIQGHGMGLAIAARVAQWHSASLTINQSNKLGGAAVKLAFPSAKDS